MWDDRPNSTKIKINPYRAKSDTLRVDRPMWDELTARMADVGMNQLVIDIGEGIRFDSHPELAAEGAWTPDEMAEEVVRLRGLGIEAIPKLNFSASHDAWLGEYAFMISSKPYYAVCSDLITEAAAIFDKPSLFHIGMDEETLHHQEQLAQVVIRQFELWYHDLRFYADAAEAAGCRPWMWSDRIWHHEEEYLANTPKSIMQSNWYYGDDFEFPAGAFDEPNSHARYVRAYETLERAGFDQIPTGSNWSNDTNMGDTVTHGNAVIDSSRLKGYLTAPWYPTLTAERDRLLTAVDQVAAAMPAETAPAAG
ncbi:hypothetical protein [Microlunatus sp. Y2014]|uniref:hypothetical protein n=1 Tax=Microlunatus sp. Y2014 TaxID=3418488 RepID=UPI003DA77138